MPTPAHATTDACGTCNSDPADDCDPNACKLEDAPCLDDGQCCAGFVCGQNATAAAEACAASSVDGNAAELELVLVVDASGSVASHEYAQQFSFGSVLMTAVLGAVVLGGVVLFAAIFVRELHRWQNALEQRKGKHKGVETQERTLEELNKKNGWQVCVW